MRILLLEDSGPILHLIRARLLNAGFEVETATNGHQGFQMATSNAYDAIVSDLQMPHWDGFKFIDAIQVICPQLPIILVTATHEDEATFSRLKSYPNVQAILRKPVDFNLLFNHLQTISPQTHTSVNKMARIVCTIGPSCDTTAPLGKMILAGMDVARLNFSHGSHEQHHKALCAIRQAEKIWDKPIAVLQDLSGPKIRTGDMRNGAIILTKGEQVIIQAEPLIGNGERISTVVPSILKDLRKGDPVLLDDGLLELRVLKSGAEEVVCEILVGGVLKSNKGINLPSTHLSLTSITEKDWQDLDWALEHSIDYVALSFVRSASDIHKVQDYIRDAGKKPLKVVAKIEKPEAVQNIHEIIQASDAIMIARGDMGVELPAAKVPRIQERIIRLCREQNTPVIIATQMLDSMTTNSRPSRAEVTDVSMAIKQGTDAVMLSQETATGIDPVNVVRTMSSIICEEERYTETSTIQLNELQQDSSVNPALSAIAGLMNISVALLLDPDGILYPSLSKWNRRVPTLLVTKSLRIARLSCLYNNIFPLIIREELDRVDMVHASLSKAKEWGYIRVGDQVAFVEGFRVTRTGFHQIGAVQVVTVQ
ncbi:pyruvate kinase [Desulfogranum japonicum]|uniref:pyruvate kinase n=1 Tax=Desulfogranum japonicum TaxID=231447 RepID=UPI00041DBA7D|nr:pyruvate kinase [Desulfogranum japonicum]